MADGSQLRQELVRANPSSEAAAALRDDLVRTEVPTALFVVSALMLLVSPVELAVAGSQKLDAYAGVVLVSFLLAGLGLVLPRSPRLLAVSPWVFSLAMVGLCAWLLLEFWLAPDLAHTGYIAVILVALGPISLEWGPFLVGAAAITLATVGTTWANGLGQPFAWASSCVIAILVSSVLLYLRRRSLAAVAAARELAEQRAIKDGLTDALNRNGLDAMLPGLLATARRLRQPVVVTFVDIDGLKAANDTHGHEFGDEIIRCVAHAVRGASRQGDLVARWGGDEFIVVGMGVESEGGAMAERISRLIDASGIDPARWSRQISLGSAHGIPSADGIEELIRRADERMYESRRARTSGVAQDR